MPQILEEVFEMPNNVFLDRIQQRTFEQIVEMPIPQVAEEHVEVILAPQERIRQGTEEQIIDVLVRQVAAEIMEIAPEQSMDVSVLQAVEEMETTSVPHVPVPQELVPRADEEML